jgi:hypothetical protein
MMVKSSLARLRREGRPGEVRTRKFKTVALEAREEENFCNQWFKRLQKRAKIALSLRDNRKIVENANFSAM